ncbi:josephin-2-like isoform X2 [Sinocyclocheilus anshuiensis]|uniref:josephin-2-like isoform X2 n=1 Tax=Sinocyclocheilus anshuiensis TaxID=1608454 RepID=UPI0007B81B64|nr:PREDICTED: josephin-2-like isoform X2 [Sinocyclocheilus anshuiensis]
MSEGEVFHEKQRLELCAIHALNNVLQERVFTKATADDICKRLAPQCVMNPHRSVLGTGNYDVNVIMAALQSRGLAAVWWDKRRHWLAVREVNGQFYNLDSKLKGPACIGGETELRSFLTEQLSQDIAEMLLVVQKEIDDDGTWLKPDETRK